MDRNWRTAVLFTATLAGAGAASAQSGIARYKCSSAAAYAELEAASAQGTAAFERTLLDAVEQGACRLLAAGDRRVAQVPSSSGEEGFPPPRGIFRPRR